MTKTKRNIFGRAFAVIGAASAAAAAIEGGRRPQASDLTTLGIDPTSFRLPIAAAKAFCRSMAHAFDRLVD